MNRLLVDTGPLVALLNRRDPDHQRGAEFLKYERARLLTTWPVITEAMYLLRHSVAAQDSLLKMIRAGSSSCRIFWDWWSESAI